MERLPIALAIIVLSATICFAGGPNYGPNYTPQNSDKEFQSVYHDLQYPKISTGTAQNFYIAAGSATAFNISSGTATNWTVKNLTISPGGTISGITGRIVQTVTFSETSGDSTTSSVFQLTSLTLAITPTSSSNSILIFTQGAGSSGTQNNTAGYSLFRGSTNLSTLGDATFAELFSAAGGQINAPIAIIYKDSPATTSATTYSVRFKSFDNTHTVFYGGANQIATMILMEVAP